MRVGFPHVVAAAAVPLIIACAILTAVTGSVAWTDVAFYILVATMAIVGFYCAWDLNRRE